MTPYRSALITGASSGIGEALAIALAAPGVTLHVSGRDQARLDLVATACRNRGATVAPHVIDVRDATAMRAWITSAGPLGLVIANAGISAGSGAMTGEPSETTRAILATNLDGALNTIFPAMAIMRRQPVEPDGWRGRIGVIASIAAFVAVPDSAAYSASKAAIDIWTVASARGARAEGIHLTSLCPGYIRTAMTARNRFPMPGLMEADRAAGVILRSIAAGRVRVAFPWWMALAARLSGLLPPRVLGMLLPDRSDPAGEKP